jgi:hypothetical protein
MIESHHSNNQQTKVMNDKFDELAKDLARSVTRRHALRRFVIGCAGVALATLGLANKAEAKWVCDCGALWYGCDPTHPGKLKSCLNFCGPRC